MTGLSGQGVPDGCTFGVYRHVTALGGVLYGYPARPLSARLVKHPEYVIIVAVAAVLLHHPAAPVPHLRRLFLCWMPWA